MRSEPPLLRRLTLTLSSPGCNTVEQEAEMANAVFLLSVYLAGREFLPLALSFPGFEARGRRRRKLTFRHASRRTTGFLRVGILHGDRLFSR